MWEERYATDEYVYGTEPNEFLKANADQLKAGSVLCLGDGEGRNGVYLAARGHDVTAVDLSASALAKAKKLAAENGIRIKTVHADLEAFEIQPGRWDNIVSVFCHLPEPLREKVHAASAKGLTDGGVFLLEGYTAEQLQKPGTGGPPVLELMYSAEILRRDFSGMEIVQAQETERTVNEGAGHCGDSAVVQFIARKNSDKS